MRRAESPSTMHSQKDFDAGFLLDQIRPLYEDKDPAHDFTHIMRVYQNAKDIGMREGGDLQILLLAALLHDAGSGAKLSLVSGETDATNSVIEDFLEKTCLPKDVKEKVLYAVEVHRFSRGIVPITREAKILQDADRLDALGAVGIARVFMTGGGLGRRMYNPEDPFCRSREPDDKMWNLDHFFSKLLRLESGMHTETARAMAARRAEVLKRYLLDLQRELEGESVRDPG